MLNRMKMFAVELKSMARRIAGRSDPWGDFRRLLRTIHPDTWRIQHEVYEWLDDRPDRAEDGIDFASDPDPVVRRGRELRDRILGEYRNKLADRADRLRILIFVPDYHATPAGYSLFKNLAAGFEFLGLPVASWHQGEPLAAHLKSFAPTLILANDPETYDPTDYLTNFDWNALGEYRRDTVLQIGLVASPYPKNPDVLRVRLAHARRLGIDFFYSFQAPSFVDRHHAPYRDRGFSVLTLEFGANPLVYYPVPGVKRDLDYAFLGTAHFEKWARYYRFFDGVITARPGLIAGPGWPNAARDRIDESFHRYLYARAKVGLNLHVPFQIEEATELNERAYNLAACGIPQLTDAPALLYMRFRPESVFVGATPGEYRDQFFRILNRPEEARTRALEALEDVLCRHTVFHRADAFVQQLETVAPGG